jgi:hypothetical protein
MRRCAVVALCVCVVGGDAVATADAQSPAPAGPHSTSVAAAPTTAASTVPATVPADPADPATPKGALKALAQALDAGDRAAVLKLLLADTGEERKVAAATADLADATAGLRRAAAKAFGEQGSRPLGVDAGATPEALARIDSATVDLAQDRATVRTPQLEGPPIVLVKRDGTWHVPVSELSKDVEAADVERNLKDVAEQTRLLRELSAEVLAGKYKTAAEARQALDARILKSAMPQLSAGGAGGAATQPATKP